MNQRTGRGINHQPACPCLQFVDVSVAYAGGTHGRTARNGRDLALQHISFTVASGQRVAVVGPNGAGKSTLLHLIAGTIQPTSGQVQIFGTGPGKHICIAYVPQRSQIDWSFPVTAADVVMMGRAGQIGLLRRPSHQDKQIVEESLARVNALPLAHKQIGELSGGQQQRIFIARALAQEAELLLLDEPLTGLDMPSQEMIFTILESLRPDGVTVLMATHDLMLAAEHFDQIMLLNQAIVAFGTPTAVFTPENLLHAFGGRMSALMQTLAPQKVGPQVVAPPEQLYDH